MIGSPSGSGNFLLVLAGLAPAAACLLSGCAATDDPATGDLLVDLRHRDPRVRIEASVRAAEEGRRDLAPELLSNLDDRDESVRFVAGIALKRLTGRDFGFISFAPPADRGEAVLRWKRFLEGAPEGSAPADATATAAAPAAGGKARTEASP